MSDKINEIFVDGVANVNLSLGAFRFDLVSLKSAAAPSSDQQPDLQHHARVVLTPQGYLQLVTSLQNFLKQVEDKGIIRREQVMGDDIHAEDAGLTKKAKDKEDK